jgi:hypothetical protein
MLSQIVKETVPPQFDALFIKSWFQQKVQLATTKPRHEPSDVHHHAFDGGKFCAALIEAVFSLVNSLPGDAKKLASAA